MQRYLAGDWNVNDFPEQSGECSSSSIYKEREDFRIDLFNLPNILRKYADSKRVWANYLKGKTGNNVEHRELLDFERKVICNTITNCLVNKVTSLRSHDYIYIFNEIRNIFPLEMMGLYYMAPHSYYDDEAQEKEAMAENGGERVGHRKKVQVVAKGQLLTSFRYRQEKYNNEKRLLDDVENRKLKRRKLNVDISTGCLEHKAWLSDNYEPWEIVEDKWTKTCSLRANDIESIKDFDTLISEWPRYTRKFAFTLIDIDFAHAFPGKSLFKLLWPKFRTIIITMALEVAQRTEKDKIKNKEMIKKLNRFNGELDEDGNLEGFTALHALFFLLPNKNKNTSQNLCKMLRKAEKGQKVEAIIRDLSENQKKMGSFHPIIIYYENEEILPYKFYTCVNDIKYEFENITTSIDILFKIFFVFDLKYPSECGNVLLFLQQFFYDIFLINDVKSVTTLSVMQKVNPERAKICNQKILAKSFDQKFI